MEDKIISYISKLSGDKIRLTELIAHFTHDISARERDVVIREKILPALINMEKNKKIQLSWDVLLNRYCFPRYIYSKADGSGPAKPEKSGTPLWQKQIEEILKKDFAINGRRIHEMRVQDRFEKFIKRYEKSSDEIAPSDDWVKVITAIMETNLSQYDVMRACIEAFKAGVIWEKYKKEFEE